MCSSTNGRPRRWYSHGVASRADGARTQDANGPNHPGGCGRLLSVHIAHEDGPEWIMCKKACFVCMYIGVNELVDQLMSAIGVRVNLC